MTEVKNTLAPEAVRRIHPPSSPQLLPVTEHLMPLTTQMTTKVR